MKLLNINLQGVDKNEYLSDIKNEILEAKTIEQLNILQNKLNHSQLEETLASALQMLLDDIKASKNYHSAP